MSTHPHLAYTTHAQANGTRKHLQTHICTQHLDKNNIAHTLSTQFERAKASVISLAREVSALTRERDSLLGIVLDAANQARLHGAQSTNGEVPLHLPTSLAQRLLEGEKVQDTICPNGCTPLTMRLQKPCAAIRTCNCTRVCLPCSVPIRSDGWADSIQSSG